jgi:anti-sigma B factor antagonist
VTPYDERDDVFDATLSSDGDRRVIAASGEIDAVSSPRLQALGVEACDRSPRLLVLDVREVTFVDSAGLNALIAIRRQAAAAGADVRLVHGAGDNVVLRLLRLVGLDGLFDLRPHDGP